MLPDQPGGLAPLAMIGKSLLGSEPRHPHVDAGQTGPATRVGPHNRDHLRGGRIEQHDVDMVVVGRRRQRGGSRSPPPTNWLLLTANWPELSKGAPLHGPWLCGKNDASDHPGASWFFAASPATLSSPPEEREKVRSLPPERPARRCLRRLDPDSEEQRAGGFFRAHHRLGKGGWKDYQRAKTSRQMQAGLPTRIRNMPFAKPAPALVECLDRMGRCGLVATLLFLATLPAQSAAQPNIVFLMADDLGWTDLACMGSDLHETPNLDRLAAEGVRFTDAYAMSVCSPTRAAILTGKHAARLHYTIWREGSFRPPTDRPLIPPATVGDLPLEERTLAEVLKEAGYLTFHVGKWHVGDAAHSPETQGFDLNIGGTHWGAPNTYFWPFSGAEYYREYRYVPGLGLGQPGQFLTDLLTDQALELMQAAGDRPFFLNLWFHNPHTPIEAKPELVAHYEARLRAGMRHRNAVYAAMIHTLDANVGRILERLDELGVAERTLVLFTSDNGGFVNVSRGRQVADNHPLRSGKGSLYEGGIRVPLIVRWPGVTTPGAICREPVVCMDFFPTFAAAAGQAAPSALDGRSLLPLLRNPRATLDREALFFHYPHYYPTTTPVSAVRAGEWKLLEYHEDGRQELYNLNADPGESANLALALPAKVAQLNSSLQSWRGAVEAQMPQPNPAAANRRAQ